jgi:hypothetical protein
LAFRAAESLNRKQWDYGRVIGHCIPPLNQAGAQNSQSPVDAEVGGDRTSMRFRIPETLVNIAHFLKHSTERNGPGVGVTRWGHSTPQGGPRHLKLAKPRGEIVIKSKNSVPGKHGEGQLESVSR